MPFAAWLFLSVGSVIARKKENQPVRPDPPARNVSTQKPAEAGSKRSGKRLPTPDYLTKTGTPVNAKSAGIQFSPLLRNALFSPRPFRG
jgi:hypothetical protein